MVTHWIALQPELADAPAPSAGDLSDPVQALGWWALRYTPKVARCGNVLLLEVAASARLWRGLPALLNHVLSAHKPVPIRAYAQAATSGVAMARLQLAACPDQAQVPIQDLPLHTLAAAQPHLDTLARLGVTTWGQLRALPRAGLSRRFGAGLLEALDQAYGLRPDIYPWLSLPEVFDAALELPSHVDSAPALLFAARRLLAQLKVWLQLRHRGVLGLELVWQMDPRRHTAHQGALPLRSAQPTQDTNHLQRLLSEHLAHVSLPAPVHTLRLRTLETAALEGESASLLPDAHSSGTDLTQMLERLSARLGADQVLRLQARMDHRPEQMQAWRSALRPAAPNTLEPASSGEKKRRHPHGVTALWAQPLTPTWLLAEPLKLALLRQRPCYQGPLTLLAGPQRLEAGWWGGGVLALRDYFVARGSLPVLLWIYQERLNGDGATQSAGDWYLHGMFA